MFLNFFGELYNYFLDFILYIVYLIRLGIGFWVLVKKIKKIILVGASAVCWALRLSRNDMVFDKNTIKILFAGVFQDNILVSRMGSITKT